MAAPCPFDSCIPSFHRAEPSSDAWVRWLVNGKGDPATWMRRWLTAGHTALDVGANEGLLSVTMAERVGGTGRVLACDPDPRCWNPWHARCSSYGWMTFLPVACGAETDDALTFYEDVGGMGTSSRYAVLLREPASPVRLVRQCRADDLLPTADLVKIDAQGGDDAVLCGAPRLLAQCPYWIIEVWPWGLLQAGTSTEALWRRLHEAGLTVRWAGGEGSPVTITDALAYQARAATPDTRHEHVNWVAER